MIATYIHPGHSIDYTPTTDVAAGDVIVAEDLIGIAKRDIPAGTLGSLAVTGVFEFPKATGPNKDIPFGKEVFWKVNQQVAAKNGGKRLGIAVRDAGAEKETVRVRLG